MNSFVYEYPTKVCFGKNAASAHLDALLGDARRILLVTGGGSVKKNGIYDSIRGLLKDRTVIDFSGVPSNPTWDKVKEGAVLARDQQVDYVLALGGGSVIDASKIIAAQALCPEDYWNAFVHEHRIPDSPVLPLGAIVTATGTGAEMNGGAVITNEEENVKTGVFAKAPRFAILDPDYTKTVPARQVFSGAFDTFCHALESYLGASLPLDLTDELSLAVMKNTIENMNVLLVDFENEQARSNLAWDSGMAENGILKIGKPTCFQTHMIEHQLGALTDCNHGQGLAVIEPRYLCCIAKRNPKKLSRLFRVVFEVEDDDDEKAIEQGLQKLEDFIAACDLPIRLDQLKSRVVIDDAILDQTADTTVLIDAGELTLNRDDVRAILEACK